MRLVTGRFLCNVILVRFCFVLLAFFLPLLLHLHLWFTFIEKIFPIQCSQLPLEDGVPAQKNEEEEQENKSSRHNSVTAAVFRTV